MRTNWFAALVFLCCTQVAAGDSKLSCPPRGYSQSDLSALKARNFVIASDDERNALALALVPCLADSNPKLRDGIAFEALSVFMRGKQLRSSSVTALMEQLIPWLSNDHSDPQGVARPFAALILSEVARMDRVAPFMTPAQRNALLNSGAQYLMNVRDYRGFDETVGWRHGVAHGADLMLQLTLNTQVDQAGLNRMLAAIATQIAPHTQNGTPHFYIYGESERLTRPVFYAAQRQQLSSEAWRTWLQGVTSPAPFLQWGEMFGSQAGLAKRHNTGAFLTALYVMVQTGGDAQTKATPLPLIVDALKQID